VPCTQLRVMEVGVERVVKGPQPLHGVRRGMGVPSAIVASRSGQQWGWVTSLTWCGTLRQQSTCTVKGDVVGVMVVWLDCEEHKDWRGLGSSDLRLSSLKRQLDQLAATITEESRNHRVLPVTVRHMAPTLRDPDSPEICPTNTYFKLFRWRPTCDHLVAHQPQPQSQYFPGIHNPLERAPT